ncbi:hypothetical protein AV530_003922 [Patagioenas fasciata monilis]|uniref:Uncharacterized protein n=1 Tax=Patagioenas fasciata monilis TaxID=372326 RepID=A0A1V4KZF3_PATFA|nr:hypothetical protein AV530_003922 [Patagioenas fasciata monilis]
MARLPVSAEDVSRECSKKNSGCSERGSVWNSLLDRRADGPCSALWRKQSCMLMCSPPWPSSAAYKS